MANTYSNIHTSHSLTNCLPSDRVSKSSMEDLKAFSLHETIFYWMSSKLYVGYRVARLIHSVLHTGCVEGYQQGRPQPWYFEARAPRRSQMFFLEVQHHIFALGGDIIPNMCEKWDSISKGLPSTSWGGLPTYSRAHRSLRVGVQLSLWIFQHGAVLQNKLCIF